MMSMPMVSVAMRGGDEYESEKTAWNTSESNKMTAAMLTKRVQKRDVKAWLCDTLMRALSSLFSWSRRPTSSFSLATQFCFFCACSFMREAARRRFVLSFSAENDGMWRCMGGNQQILFEPLKKNFFHSPHIFTHTPLHPHAMADVPKKEDDNHVNIKVVSQDHNEVLALLRPRRSHCALHSRTFRVPRPLHNARQPFTPFSHTGLLQD